MDLDSLKKSVANLTLYDIKAGVRQVQNAVMNYTEMEAKVREATNNDPWYVLEPLLRGLSDVEGYFEYANYPARTRFRARRHTDFISGAPPLLSCKKSQMALTPTNNSTRSCPLSISASQTKQPKNGVRSINHFNCLNFWSRTAPNVL